MKKYVSLLLSIFIPLFITFIVFIIWVITRQDKVMYIVGFCFGITISSFLIGILAFIRNKRNYRCHFDERQNKCRGDCFCISFFVLLGSLFLDGIIRTLLEYDWSSYIVGVSTCGILSIGVFAGTAILKDAYTSIGENKIRFGIFLGCIGILDLGVGIINGIRQGFLEDGKIGISFINIFSGFMLFVVAILLFIKTGISKKKERMDDEKFETEIC